MGKEGSSPHSMTERLLVTLYFFCVCQDEEREDHELPGPLRNTLSSSSSLHLFSNQLFIPLQHHTMGGMHHKYIQAHWHVHTYTHKYRKAHTFKSRTCHQALMPVVDYIHTNNKGEPPFTKNKRSL